MSDRRITDVELAAKEAEFLLNHPILKQAFMDVKEGYVEDIITCDITDNNKRNQLMFGLKNLNEVLLKIQEKVEDALLQQQT